MTTQRARKRNTPRRAPETIEPSLREARAQIAQELSALSEYLDECAKDRVTRGEWSETWA